MDANFSQDWEVFQVALGSLDGNGREERSRSFVNLLRRHAERQGLFLISAATAYFNQYPDEYSGLVVDSLLTPNDDSTVEYIADCEAGGLTVAAARDQRAALLDYWRVVGDYASPILVQPYYEAFLANQAPVRYRQITDAAELYPSTPN